MHYFLLFLFLINAAHAALPQDSTSPLLPTLTTSNIYCKKIVIDPNDTKPPIASGENVQQTCPMGYVPGGIAISDFEAGAAGVTQAKKHWFFDNKNPSLSHNKYIAYHSGNTTYYSVPGAKTGGVPPFNTSSTDSIWYRSKINTVKLICYRRKIVFTAGSCTQ